MQKNKAHNVDLLNEKPIKSIVLLTLPMVASSLIQQLYNLTDTFWISYQGSEAVAALGAAGTFLWFTQSFMVMIRTGGQVLIGQASGAKDKKLVDELAASSIQLSILLGLVIGFIQLVFTPQQIAFVGLESQTTIGLAEAYLAISAVGVPFTFLTGVFTGILSAVGNTRIAFKASALGLVINMILDPVFIILLDMSAAGAAVATVIGQVVSFLIILRDVLRFELFPNALNVPKFAGLRKIYDKEHYSRIFRIGLPAGLQNALYSGISIVLNRTVASFGDIQISAKKIGGQFENLAWTVAQAIGSSLNSFTAQNIAARKYSRIKDGFRAGLVLSLGLGLFSTMIMVVFPNQILNIFFNNQAEIAAGVGYMVIVGYSQIFQCVELMSTGAFSGSGNTLYPSIVVSTMTLLRLPLAAALSATPLGIDGVWIAISATSVLKGLILYISYEITLRNKKKKMLAGELDVI